VKEQDKKLIDSLRKDVSRKEKAGRERRTLLAQTIYLGTLGILISLPIVIGAYLGQWLDEKLTGFSFSWTISLILIGVLIGCLNVYFLVRENE